MQNEGSNASCSFVCENDKETHNSSMLSQKGDDGNPTLVTIVISSGESQEPKDELLNDELPSVPSLSPKKGHLSRTSSSHDQCSYCCFYARDTMNEKIKSFQLVCQHDKEEVLIDLGCQCRGGLAKVHRSCIDTWFQTRGSNKCEICQETAANVPPPESQPTTNYLVWSIDPTFRSQNRERGCFSPLWVAFSILIGGLLLDVLISITLGVSALPVNIIIGVIVLLGLGTALRLALEFCHEWSLRRVVQRVETNVNLGYHPAL